MDDGGPESPLHPLFMTKLDKGWEENENIQALGAIIDEAEAELSERGEGVGEDEDGSDSESDKSDSSDSDSSDEDVRKPKFSRQPPSRRGSDGKSKRPARRKQNQKKHTRLTPKSQLRGDVGLSTIAMGFVNVKDPK